MKHEGHTYYDPDSPMASALDRAYEQHVEYGEHWVTLVATQHKVVRSQRYNTERTLVLERLTDGLQVVYIKTEDGWRDATEA